MVGNNGEMYPDLVRQVYREGDDIGSHTYTHPNLGAISDAQVHLELSATQRAIQSITGHSTVLFRPPFNADSEPQTNEEVYPIWLASQQNYLTIGESIDPQDWNLKSYGPDGKPVTRTWVDIVRDTLEGRHAATRSALPLHDEGLHR